MKYDNNDLCLRERFRGPYILRGFIVAFSIHNYGFHFDQYGDHFVDQYLPQCKRKKMPT